MSKLECRLSSFLFEFIPQLALCEEQLITVLQPGKKKKSLPSLQVPQSLHQGIEVESIRTIKIILVPMGPLMLFGSQCLIEGILHPSRLGTICLVTCTAARRYVQYHYKNDDPREIQRPDDLHSHRCLAGTRAASDSNDTQIFPWRRVSLFLVGGGRVNGWEGLHLVSQSR